VAAATGRALPGGSERYRRVLAALIGRWQVKGMDEIFLPTPMIGK
jgi:hypothetical protein